MWRERERERPWEWNKSYVTSPIRHTKVHGHENQTTALLFESWALVWEARQGNVGQRLCSASVHASCPATFHGPGVSGPPKGGRQQLDALCQGEINNVPLRLADHKISAGDDRYFLLRNSLETPRLWQKYIYKLQNQLHIMQIKIDCLSVFVCVCMLERETERHRAASWRHRDTAATGSQSGRQSSASSSDARVLNDSWVMIPHLQWLAKRVHS